MATKRWERGRLPFVSAFVVDFGNSPEAKRNRRGCFVIVAVLAIFLALYLAVGLSGDPRNEVSEDISAVPVN